VSDGYRDQLRLLAIFHGVLAGLTVLASLFPLLYVGLGAFFLRGELGGPNPPPPFVGWFMVAFGLAFWLGIVAFAVMLGVAARFLARARHWTYCVVTAGLACAFFPFGTALGVFTVVVLARPEVKATFEARAGPAHS
jgi:hypothetical protein